jgi:hypothetical protein
MFPPIIARFVRYHLLVWLDTTGIYMDLEGLFILIPPAISSRMII